MNLQVTLKHAGKAVKTVSVTLSDASPIVLKGDLAPAGSPFPANHPLVVLEGKEVLVQLAPGVDAALIRGASTVKLSDLRAKGHAKKVGAFEALPLPEATAAEITLSGWSIVIEPAKGRAAAPVGAPVKAPPGAISGAGTGAISADIWAHYRMFSETARVTTFSKVAVVSLIVHLSIMFFFATRVIVHDPFEMNEVPERFAKFLVPPVEEAPPVAAPTATKAVETTKTEEAAEAPAAGNENAGGDDKPAAPSDAAKKAAQLAKVKNSGLLAIIGSKSGGGGALHDVLSDNALGGDLDKALAGVGKTGLGVAKTGEDLKGGGTRGGTGYGTADIGKLNTGGGGRGVGLGAKASTDVKSEIATGEISASGSLDSSAIASVVKSKISGIKYCYEKELKNNPKLAGKVVVAFTIGETGEVTAYSVENSTLNNAQVEQCILRMIRRWKFPAPSGGTVSVSYPFIFTAQG